MYKKMGRAFNLNQAGGAVGLALICSALTGCMTVPVASYQPTIANVQALKAASQKPLAVDAFSGGTNKISIRGNGAISPVGNGFADYVQDALSQELQKAELLLPSSDLHVRGNVTSTDIDAAIGTGHTTVTVEFTITKAGVEKFRKTLSANYAWESSFAGAIAIPRGRETYPKAVEQLLGELYADPDFVRALM